MKKVVIVLLIVAFVVSMALSVSCKTGGTAETTAAATAAAGETTAAAATTAAGAETTVADAAKKYAGTTIRYLGTTEFENMLFKELVPQFEEETGIKVELELIGLNDQMQKYRLEASKGSSNYDVYEQSTYDSSIFFSNDWLANIDELEKSTGVSFNRETYIPNYFDKVAQYNGVTLGLPMVFCSNLLQYRNDLLSKQEEKDAFKTQFGYDLDVPKTWDQFYDVAKFFTRDNDKDGENDFYGAAMVLDAGGAIYDMWLMRYLSGEMEPTAQGKNYNFLLDDNLQPTFNGKAGLKALEDIVKIYKDGYLYPGALSMGWSQCVEPMRAGDTFMTYMWAETILPSMLANDNEFAENMKWATMPTYANKRAEFGAWMFCINKNSKNKEAAYLFCQWMTKAETEVKLNGLGTGFKFPTRKENFDNPDFFKGYEFYLTVKDTISNYELYPEIFIPEQDVIQQNLNVEFQRAVTGEKTAQQALDDAAANIVKGLTDAGAYDRIKK
jgi:multiple sugar transport system substrate-binding protein